VDQEKLELIKSIKLNCWIVQKNKIKVGHSYVYLESEIEFEKI